MKKCIVLLVCVCIINAAPEKAQRTTLDGRLNTMNSRINSLETKVDRIDNSIEDIKGMLKKNNGSTATVVESKPLTRTVSSYPSRTTISYPSRTTTTHTIRSPRTGCTAGGCAASEFTPSGDMDCKLYCNRMYAGIDEQQRACYARCGSSNDPVNSGIVQY